jgi:hypothetical protein
MHTKWTAEDTFVGWSYWLGLFDANTVTGVSR